ncbi:MAG: hypothetical protein ACREMY_09095, partial [bacterium]
MTGELGQLLRLLRMVRCPGCALGGDSLAQGEAPILFQLFHQHPAFRGSTGCQVCPTSESPKRGISYSG